MTEILTIATPELGDRSYLVWSGPSAVVVDPQRDLDRILAELQRLELRLELVLETHLHNDYVSGGLELSRRTGAEYAVAGGEEASYPCIAVREGTHLQAGSLRFLALATPGHTVGHCSYLLQGSDGAGAVFTGGSMLYGNVGRTDLVSAELTEPLSRQQHRSVRRLARDLAEMVTVHPTHGFGSFCASGETKQVTSSTVGEERRENLACTIDSEDEFVRVLLAGLGAFPSYYAHMGLINRAGPSALDLSPPVRLDPQEVWRRAGTPEWVVDLRPRQQFAKSHLRGSVCVEYDPEMFTAYLGWVLPWGTPITLLAEDEQQAGEAQRSLARIGIDRPSGVAFYSELDSSDPSWQASYPLLDFRALASSQQKASVIDVRTDDEWSQGHLSGATHVPLAQLPEATEDLPPGPLAVHCQRGYRAAIAASLLARAGRDVVLVSDDFEAAEAAGLTIESRA